MIFGAITFDGNKGFSCSHSMRQREYVQDAFAQSLGHGAALRSALLKLLADQPTEDVSKWSELRHTHPVIYERIRRLEMLEGWRAPEDK